MLLSVDDALARIVGEARSLGTERVTLDRAAGRVLVEPVVASVDNPPFDASAMDGYAVRAADVRDGQSLPLAGVSQAGGETAHSLAPGTCVRIFTGAPMPKGADAVVMQEQTIAENGQVTFLADSTAGKNVRKRGNDFLTGAKLVEAGVALKPADVALIAAANQPYVTVAKRPRIALMATGNELVAPGSPLLAGQIVASNSFGLAVLLAPLASDVFNWGIVPDDRIILDGALGAALDAEPDILITTGGASVGEHDLVQDSLKANGVDIDFWRIAMRPGKPLMFGRKGKTLVFGLPGNPVSALVTAHVFVMAAVRAILEQTPPAPLLLPLVSPLKPNGPRRHFVRSFLSTTSEGQTGVQPVGETDSGHLSSLARSNCLIVQPEHCEGKSTGSIVEVILI